MPNPEKKLFLPVEAAATDQEFVKNPGGEANLALDSSDSYELKFNQNGTIRTLSTLTGTQTLTNKTLTSVKVTRPVRSITASTGSVTAADYGGAVFMNRAAGSAISLPTPVSGASVILFVGTAPTGGTGYVITSNAANEVVGGVGTTDVNSVTDPDFEAAGANTITFVNDKAVIGDWIELISNGTLWFARGHSSVFDAITFTDV